MRGARSANVSYGSRADETDLHQALPLCPQQLTESLQRGEVGR